MALKLALEHPDRLSGAMLLSGSSAALSSSDHALKNAASSAPAQHFMVAHGTNDSVVPLREGEAVRDLLVARGAQVDWHVLAGRTHFDVLAPECHFLENAIQWLVSRLDASSASAVSSAGSPAATDVPVGVYHSVQ